MNNYSLSYYIIYGETICQEYLKGVSVISKQRWHIPCMIGVHTPIWVVMVSCICKRILHIAAALAAAVDMESEDRSPARHAGHLRRSLRIHSVARHLRWSWVLRTLGWHGI